MQERGGGARLGQALAKELPEVSVGAGIEGTKLLLGGVAICRMVSVRFGKVSEGVGNWFGSVFIFIPLKVQFGLAVNLRLGL